MTTKYFLKGDSKNTSFKRKLRNEMTPAENRLWLKLRVKQFNNLKFRRQHGIGPYIVDFYCSEKSLVVEVDGDVHALGKQVLKDKYREEYLQKLGLRIIRYCNNDVITNIDGVMEDLYQKITEELPPYSPPYNPKGAISWRGTLRNETRNIRKIIY